MKKLLILASALFAFISCSKDETTIDTPNSWDNEGLSFYTSILPETKVTSDQFETGDQIYVSAFENGASYATDVLYSYGSSLFESENPICYDEVNEDGSASSQELSFMAVYPAIEGFASSFTFTAATDQSSSDSYELSDLLTAKTDATSSSNPSLIFSHRMSSLVVNITSEEALGGGVLTVFAQNSAIIDISDSSFTATGSATEITAASNGDLSYKVIFAPQTIAAGDVVATYVVGDVTYAWTASSEIVFQSGYRRTYNWAVDSGDIDLDGIIEGWQDDEITDDPATGDDDVVVSEEALASLQGFDYYVVALDDASYESISSEVCTDLRVDDSNSCLYIWAGYDTATCSGTNAFGHDAEWSSFTVNSSAGWSGLGYCNGVAGDYAALNSMSDITDAPEDYYLHVAFKSDVAASHYIKLESNNGTSGGCTIGNNGAIESRSPDYTLTTDGTWQHFDIPMTHFTSQGLVFDSACSAAANTFIILSGSTHGTPLDYDAVFFYKKVDSETTTGSDDDNTDDTPTTDNGSATWDGTVASSFAAGSGSAADPYIIASASELAYVSSMANGSTLENVYFSLAADIDLNGLAWDAIGNNTFFFWGQFEGNGHTISGLSITGSESYQGLFAATGNNGYVGNLSVSGSVEAFENVGGIVGFNFGTIKNCSSSVDVTANIFGGGIAGYNQSSGNIINCSNSGTIVAGNHNGGIAGYAWGAVTNCYNEGAVGNYDSTYYSGGIVGYCNATVTNCYNVGSVKGVASNGGVVGYNETGSVANCYSLSGQVESAQSAFGVNGTEMSSSEMSAADFVATLNNNAASFNTSSPSVAACAWVAGSTYPALDFDATPSSNGDESGSTGDESGDDGSSDSALIQGYADDGTLSLAGSDYFVISMDATSLTKIEGKVVADFTASTWASTWAGYAAAACSGTNSYGVSADWNSFTVYSSDGWSGLGHIGSADASELAKLDAMAAITDSASEYYLHIAFKSEVAATHMVKFESNGSASFAIGNNGAQVDGLEPGAELITDGAWYHYDIPVTELTAQGFSFKTGNEAAANVFMIFSGAVNSTLDYDAVFFYKK